MEKQRHRREAHETSVPRVLCGGVVPLGNLLSPLSRDRLQRLRDVAAEANGAAPGRVLPERVVVAAVPPTPKPHSHVAAVKGSPADERVGHAEAHGGVVRPLATLQVEDVGLLVESQGAEVESRAAWPSVVLCGLELEGMPEGISDAHAAEAAHGAVEQVVPLGRADQGALPVDMEATQQGVAVEIVLAKAHDLHLLGVALAIHSGQHLLGHRVRCCCARRRRSAGAAAARLRRRRPLRGAGHRHR
mmetsp:Transcript_56463/g.163758  ORF Transcript_56463/g.163758 Transcript_56463/m.163758 type:complete len:246 (-) Transcript_56463:75-812(-)